MPSPTPSLTATCFRPRADSCQDLANLALDVANFVLHTPKAKAKPKLLTPFSENDVRYICSRGLPKGSLIVSYNEECHLMHNTSGDTTLDEIAAKPLNIVYKKSTVRASVEQPALAIMNAVSSFKMDREKDASRHIVHSHTGVYKLYRLALLD